MGTWWWYWRAGGFWRAHGVGTRARRRTAARRSQAALPRKAVATLTVTMPHDHDHRRRRRRHASRADEARPFLGGSWASPFTAAAVAQARSCSHFSPPLYLHRDRIFTAVAAARSSASPVYDAPRPRAAEACCKEVERRQRRHRPNSNHSKHIEDPLRSYFDGLVDSASHVKAFMDTSSYKANSCKNSTRR